MILAACQRKTDHSPIASKCHSFTIAHVMIALGTLLKGSANLSG